MVGSAGRVVASNARDARFESRHRQFYLLSTVLNQCGNDENKEESGREWPILIKRKQIKMHRNCKNASALRSNSNPYLSYKNIVQSRVTVWLDHLNFAF